MYLDLDISLLQNTMIEVGLSNNEYIKFINKFNSSGAKKKDLLDNIIDKILSKSQVPLFIKQEFCANNNKKCEKTCNPFFSASKTNELKTKCNITSKYNNIYNQNTMDFNCKFVNKEIDTSSGKIVELNCSNSTIDNNKINIIQNLLKESNNHLLKTCNQYMKDINTDVNCSDSGIHSHNSLKFKYKDPTTHKFIYVKNIFVYERIHKNGKTIIQKDSNNQLGIGKKIGIGGDPKKMKGSGDYEVKWLDSNDKNILDIIQFEPNNNLIVGKTENESLLLYLAISKNNKIIWTDNNLQMNIDEEDNYKKIYMEEEHTSIANQIRLQYELWLRNELNKKEYCLNSEHCIYNPIDGVCLDKPLNVCKTNYIEFKPACKNVNIKSKDDIDICFGKTKENCEEDDPNCISNCNKNLNTHIKESIDMQDGLEILWNMAYKYKIDVHGTGMMKIVEGPANCPKAYQKFLNKKYKLNLKKFYYVPVALKMI